MTVLEVLGDIPPSPNVVKREYRNPHKYQRLRKSWEWELFTAPAPHHRRALILQAKKPGKLWVQVEMYHARFYDPDNAIGAQKVVLDALVNIHFLAGDSPDKLDLRGVVQLKRPHKERKTVVKIGVVE